MITKTSVQVHVPFAYEWFERGAKRFRQAVCEMVSHKIYD